MYDGLEIKINCVILMLLSVWKDLIFILIWLLMFLIYFQRFLIVLNEWNIIYLSYNNVN